MIVILSIMLGIFLIILVSNNAILSSSGSRLNHERANAALDDVSNAANLVYQQGSGAKMKVYVTVPQNAYDSLVWNKTITLDLHVKDSKTQTLYRVLDFDVNGTFPNASGSYWVTVEAFDDYVNVSW